MMEPMSLCKNTGKTRVWIIYIFSTGRDSELKTTACFRLLWTNLSLWLHVATVRCFFWIVLKHFSEDLEHRTKFGFTKRTCIFFKNYLPCFGSYGIISFFEPHLSLSSTTCTHVFEVWMICFIFLLHLRSICKMFVFIILQTKSYTSRSRSIPGKSSSAFSSWQFSIRAHLRHLGQLLSTFLLLCIAHFLFYFISFSKSCFS